MVEKKEDVPMGDQGNVGQKAEQKIQEKYAVTNAIQEEADLDEYGEELEFEDSDGDQSDEEEAKAAQDEEEEKVADQ